MSEFRTRAAQLEGAFEHNPVIRAVNFHSTPASRRDQYERQLASYSRAFSSVNEAELLAYLRTGHWQKDKPGLIVSVFEGYRNSFEVLAPLLDRYGFVGWFWLITGFLNSPVPQQRDFAEHHDIDMQTHEYPDGRYALTWQEVRLLSRRHVMACHSRSHTLLAPLSPEQQREEIVGPQADFRRELRRPARAFVSLTGPAYGENAVTDRLIDEAGYELVLSNFRIQRIRG
ncbi:MAG: polysaccharide deacetylase family protein [Gammaproteobacteria bacterium]|nr:polysaccharide deacetylase family protein [Gammaproteobacteria bacterium]